MQNTISLKRRIIMDKKQLLEEFRSPDAAYRGKPFWSWNGELREKELVRQAHVMKEMGLGGYFMHSRTGLITEYLGDEWFDLINKVADAAKEDGMEAWLYDEDRWPSGSAGGMVTEDPQYRMKGLFVYNSSLENVDWNDESISLFVAKMDGINLYTYKEIDVNNIKCKNCALREAKKAIEEIGETNDSGEWRVLRFAIVPDAPNSNYNGNTYIDTMSRKATNRFLELTHEKYAKYCGNRLGDGIKGIFTDEPHRGHCLDNERENNGVISSSIAYTDDIFEEFIKRYGFDPKPMLPELFYRKNGEHVAPIKLHYIDLTCNLFVERFIIPINNWCKEHNIIFTGHVLHEDSLMSQTAPNGSLMRTYEHMEYPGIDCLTEHNRAYWIVKQLSSVTRQMNKKWLLSELYGCTGWQFNFKGHKVVGDWQALFGINLRCQHLSWYTMEGESKRDYPASILHQSPYYKYYSTVEDHFARMGLILSEGDASCDVLLLNPIESVWCQAYSGWAHWVSNASSDVAPYERRYAELFHYLTDNQIDFDYGEEYIMSNHAKVVTENGIPTLKINNASYKTVIVSNMLTMRPSTLNLLREFKEKGGNVIFCGDAPTYIDAIPSDEAYKLSLECISVPYGEKELVDAVRKCSDGYVSIKNNDGSVNKNIFVQVRKNFNGGYAIVVLNTDKDRAMNDLTLSFTADEGYFVEEWDMDHGVRYSANNNTEYKNGEYSISLSMYPADTRCFVLTKENDTTLKSRNTYVDIRENTVSGNYQYIREEENVCVLDYCKWRWKDKEFHNETEVLRADREIRSDIGIEWRGGEMLQPWFAKSHDQKIYGDIELSYEFFIDTIPNGPVYLAGERPELNNYKINGVKLENTDIDDFYIDDCFKKMAIPHDALKIGRNEITVNVAFKRTTNIEAIYLIGDFGVKIDGHTSTITTLPSHIGCENYINYNMPFYSGNLTYIVPFESYKEAVGEIEDGCRVIFTPDRFTGGCVNVKYGDKKTVLAWDPYEADITEAYNNKLPLFITVVGVRTNTFGPLHEVLKPAPHCGPGNFTTGGDGWTDNYSLLDSGLRGFTYKVQKIK